MIKFSKKVEACCKNASTHKMLILQAFYNMIGKMVEACVFYASTCKLLSGMLLVVAVEAWRNVSTFYAHMRAHNSEVCLHASTMMILVNKYGQKRVEA